MSKNHPNDNIYSILGKLEALKPTPEEKRFALVKEIRESVEAQGSILSGVDAVQAKLAKQFAESVTEGEVTRMPGKTIHRSTNAYGGGSDTQGVEFAKQKHHADLNKVNKPLTKSLEKGMDVDMDEKAPPGAKAERMVKGIKKSLSKDGHLSGKDKAIAYATTWKAHNKGQVEESGEVCVECGLVETECSCDHTNEGEITRKPGVTTHTKTDYPGYPTDDTEDSLDKLSGPGAGKKGRPRKAQTKNPRPVAGAEKKGRGRPAKAKTVGSSSLADPFGRISGAVPAGKKGKVHSMAEAMEQLELNLLQLNEGRYLEDSTGESFNHILNRFRTEVRNFEQGGDLDKDLYDALFDYYAECGEMPYGTQKARTGDPYRWVAERLEAELGDIAYGKDPANAEGHGLEMEAGIPGSLPPEQIPGKEDLLKGKGRSYYEEEVTMEDELNELARLAGIHSEGNAFTGKLKDTAKGDSFELDGKTFKDTSTLDEEPEMEGNAFGKAVRDAKADGVQPGEKVKVGGEEYPVKESFEQPDAPEFQLNTSIDSEGNKTVNINAEGHQAEALLQMLKMAGLGSSDKAQELQQEPVSVEVIGGDEGSEEVEEADAPVDAPATQPANAPDEQYSTMRASTMGPGEGDNGEKAMNPDRPTFKNGDNALSNPPARGKEVLKAVAALESKLAAEYESIKKVSR